jgi:RNA polymerase sigma-70 factor (ECF subfamily)
MELSENIPVLLHNLKNGDLKAFDQLYAHFHMKVFQLAMRFLPYKEDAEEIVQNVFIAIWNNREDIDERRNVDAYILTIARHNIYNALRKAVYRQGYFDYLHHHTDDHSYVTEEVVMYNELDHLMHKFLNDLPPKRREIFRLFREEGLSYKEISQRLSITASTVNSQLTKAIDYIRKNIRLAYGEP